jgi:RNA polymerase II elongation factor ELL
MPPSPALSGIGSPSLASSGNTAQERVKQQRFPILHELAVQELSRSDLWARWDEGTEEEFMTALNKVADFDKDHQKWVLKRNCWKELDVFEYDYANEEDRQKAINNAIRQYDRLRISASDPLWQKLLPKAERGKGTCLSRLQAALAKGPSVPAAKQRADTASVSGGDSEKDDPTALKKGKGGEAMSRSSSQTSTTGKKKLSASEARAKRLLADPKKKKAVVEPTKKAAPKTAAPKSTAAAKAKPTKDERVLSKEIVTDSDSSDEEVSLAASTKPKAPAASTSKPPQRVAERPRATEKTRESLPLKPKPAAMTKAPPREEKREKERDTIRAQVIAKPIKPRTKRSWEDDDDDSSSSGTPLSKRTKPVAKALPAPTTSSAKARTASDASQNSRGGANSGAAVPKAKNTSPAKSSPLASSPPTNASDADQERRDRLARIRDRERERDRDRERGRDTAVRSSSSSTDSSSVGAGVARKRPLPGAADNHHNRAAKRLRPSQEAIEMATRFKHFYARYQQLHHDITSHDNPDPGKVTDLLDMHERLSRWKTEIYAAVEA